MGFGQPVHVAACGAVAGGDRTCIRLDSAKVLVHSQQASDRVALGCCSNGPMQPVLLPPLCRAVVVRGALHVLDHISLGKDATREAFTHSHKVQRLPHISLSSGGTKWHKGETRSADDPNLMGVTTVLAYCIAIDRDV